MITSQTRNSPVFFFLMGVLFFSIALLTSQLAWANDAINQCLISYHARSPEYAIPFCKVAAENGSAEAQTRLGISYVYGGQKIPEGIAWLKKAVKQGHADAEFELGLMYQLGRGVRKDDVKAREWYLRAAIQGHTYASYNLGLSYLLSTSIPRDNIEAVKWLRQAAESGYIYAQFDLGLLYFDGKVTPKNYPEAIKWFRKAAEQGYPQAQHNLGFMFFRGNGIRQNYHEAAKWFREAAKQRYAFAQYALGVLYQNGLGVERDIEKAKKWYGMPASRRYGKSLAALQSIIQQESENSGQLLYADQNKIEKAPFLVLRPITQLPPISLQIYKNACEALEDRRFVLDHGMEYQQLLSKCEARMRKKGSARDIFLFATHKYNVQAIGLLSKQKSAEQLENSKERNYWERKSAEKGYFDAQYDLGTSCLLVGNICQPGEAEKWLKKAAEQNHAGIYCMAKGVYPNSENKQLKWFTKAAIVGEECGVEKITLHYAKKGDQFLPVAYAWRKRWFDLYDKLKRHKNTFQQQILEMLMMKFTQDFKAFSKSEQMDKKQEALSVQYLDDIRNGRISEVGLPKSFD